MNGAHISGAGIGTLVGAVAAQALKKWAGVNLDSADAALIGSGALAAGAGVAHVISSVGLIPAIRRALLGPEVKLEPPAA